MPGADWVAAEETPVPAEEGAGRLGVQEQETWRHHLTRYSSYTTCKRFFKCTKVPFNTSRHWWASSLKSNISLSQGEYCTISRTGGSDTGQSGPTNSIEVYNRSYPHSTSVTYMIPNRSVTGQTCSADTGDSGIAIQRNNSGKYTILNEFYFPDFSGWKRGGQQPVINLRALNQFVRVEHFKMESLHLLPDTLQQRNWIVKMCLKMPTSKS